MSTGFHELLDDDLDEALERVLAPRLAELLRSRSPGHCARVTDIGVELAIRLCRRVTTAVSNGALVRVLGNPPDVPEDVAVSSTKLIELRNPEDDRQRPPLLVFIPPGIRASAEDSFDVATFEEVSVGDVYAELESRLLAEAPDHLRQGARDIFASVGEKEWPYADALARARYLLTVQLNDSDLDVAGAAIYELGLVPDFELFTDPALIPSRIALNLGQMRILHRSDRPERQRVLELALTDADFRSQLAEFVVDAGLEHPRAWTRRIVVDRASRRFAFHRWLLEEEQRSDTLDVSVHSPLDLPRAGDRPEHENHPALAAITGQPYLVAGRRGVNQLAVSFDVAPDPRQAPGLTRFVAELVSEESGPTGVVGSVKVAKTAKRTYKATLKKLRSTDLDAGWHYIRVLPRDEAGVPLPLERSSRGSYPANESDRFYVVAESEDIEPPPTPRSLKKAGLTQALRDLQFTAAEEGRDWQSVQCVQIGWKSVQGAGRSTVLADLGAHGKVEVPLPQELTGVQRQILADPGRMGRWRLSPHDGEAGNAVFEPAGRVELGGEAFADFRQARAEVFEAVRGEENLVVEGTALSRIKESVQTYAETYNELLTGLLAQAERSDEQQAAQILRELAALLQVDTVAVDLNRGDSGRVELTLISPTHPLRLLWLITWAEVGIRWLHDSREIDPRTVGAVGRSLRELTPLGFPLVIPVGEGRLTMLWQDLTPYWGVALPAQAENPQALFAELVAVLGIEERVSGEWAFSGARLADRVERYLRLHPYVSTLVIAAVNPARGEHLAEMLVELQRRPGLGDISYELRLFGENPEAPGFGAALFQLMRGEWSTAVGAEVFHTRMGTGTVPKLAVALRPLGEFRSALIEHTVNVTLLFDAFGGELFDAVPASERGLVPAHGLVQDVDVDYTENDGTVTWHKQPRHGRAWPVAGAEELSDLLAALPSAVSAAASAVTTRQVGTRLVPRTTLTLETGDSALLYQAHRSSDWVITIDRTLGVEYFDAPESTRRLEHVIDFEPDGATGLGHHVVISSRSAAELQALLAAVIEQHGLRVDARHAATFFDQLRLLSGRLALKLASTSATQRTEILGLALARLFLDHQNVLADQIVVPLDAHLELYRDARRADDVGESVGLQRTDLALFSLDARRRTVMCRLVEVKSYSSLTTPAAYEQLKEKIHEQLAQSARILADHFDPNRMRPDRPDRPVKNAELANLLRPYLDRAKRYRTMRPETDKEARWLLERLDPGYRLDFTRTGLIFDLAGEGMTTETESGVEFYRIGRDVATELLEAIPTEQDLADHTAALTSPTLVRLDQELLQAAFRSPQRSHEIPDETPYADLVGQEEEPTQDQGVDEEPNPQEPQIPETTHQPEEAPSVLPAKVEARSERPVVPPDVFLGTAKPSPQYGVLGEAAGQKIALDLNETHTISLFGIQGGGKSYTLGSIIESASLPAAPVNELLNPLATIVFHYSPTLDYAPEFTSMVRPNSEPDQIRVLAERYGGDPHRMSDVIMLVPEDQLSERQSEYPDIEIRPLKFSSSELRAEHWRFLMGAVGNQSTYIRQLQRIMKANRRDLRLGAIRDGVDQSSMSDALKQLAHQRLDLAEEYIDDEASVKDLVKPGRMIIVDLRDEFIEKDEALGLFVVLMQIFAEAQEKDRRFNKLVVFDEVHKYIENPDLVDGLVESVREMRHKGMSVLVASQDPPSVPIKLIELSDHVILHKFTSPAWLKHMQKANGALADLTPARMASLNPGQAYLWASKATDANFTRGAVRVHLRPRITFHGGGTKTATG